MEKESWLKELETGDKVIVASGGYYGKSRRLTTVKRTTPSGIIIVQSENGAVEERFKDGTEMYNKSSRAALRSCHDSLEEATPENIKQLENEKAIKDTAHNMSHYCDYTNKWPGEKWLRIKAILDEGREI